MRARNCLILMSLCLLGPLAVANAQPKPTTQPEEFVIPDVRFDNVRFSDVVEFLHDVVPGFQVQVLREAGVPPEYPMVTFRARNISTAQMMQFFTNAYSVKWEKIDGPRDSIYIARVPVSDMVNAQPAARSGTFVYNLSDIAPNTKDPMSDVLSIIQAALEQAHVPPPKLKVHEATRTLVVTGNPESVSIVQSVITSLQPSETVLEARVKQAQQEQKYLQAEYETKLRSMEHERQTMEATIDELRHQVEDLRTRLATTPREPAAKQ